MNLRKHPVWKEAADIIACRVENEGYGFLITHDELNYYLDLPVFDKKTIMTIEEHSLYTVDRCRKIDRLKVELLNRNLFLFNEYAEGYKVLCPDDQVSDGWNSEMKKQLKHLRKGLNILLHVDRGKLTNQRILDHNLNFNIFAIKTVQKKEKRFLPNGQKKRWKRDLAQVL